VISLAPAGQKAGRDSSVFVFIQRKKIEKQSGAHQCRSVRLRNIRFTSPGSQGGWTNPNFNRWVNRSSGSCDWKNGRKN
jgi:hypothetical protein